MRVRELCRSAVAFSLVLSPSLIAADQTFLRLTADGEAVTGEVVFEGRKGTIECSEFSFGTERTYTDGVPSLPRFSLVTLRKTVDSTSVRLLQAFGEAEPCVAEFQFFRETGGGNEELAYTIRTEGFISSLETSVPPGSSFPIESVSFTVSKADWTYNGPPGDDGTYTIDLNPTPPKSTSTITVE